MKNIIDMLNAALDELRTTLIERDRTIVDMRHEIANLVDRIGLQQSIIAGLRAHADAPTAPLDFQRLFERVLALEHDVDVMKENIRHERN